jgi:hypothetical protein
VCAVAITCAALVGVGIAIGVTLDTRLPGVDPFNITVFCWALAAFILLLAKSIYVENWLWRDFLLRRVVCQSVTELSYITRIDQQDIITYLLHNKMSTILVTKGLYNSTFLRSDKDGFSIDVKPRFRTMLLSGLVVVKVATMRGPALIMLPVRKGRKFVGFYHVHIEKDDQDVLACIDPPQKHKENQGRSLKDLDITLTRVQLGWNRVLGLYNLPNSAFR